MLLLVLLLTLLVCSNPSLQVPFFPAAVPATTTMTTTSLFKGVPILPDLNKTAGERRVVYYHEQIVAVIDILDERKLVHCELIEVYEPSQAEEVLKNLSTTLKSHRISFKDMIKLMDKCDKLDENSSRALNLEAVTVTTEPSIRGNPLLAGIIPGTKWCGTGDIAASYHDLGFRTTIDRCCRAHDLCPVKIRAYKTRYNLVNNSFFSKSHCTCDDTFYQCLKSINHVSATIIGNIYFNIAQPSCIKPSAATATTAATAGADENCYKFVPVKKRF